MSVFFSNANPNFRIPYTENFAIVVPGQLGGLSDGSFYALTALGNTDQMSLLEELEVGAGREVSPKKLSAILARTAIEPFFLVLDTATAQKVRECRWSPSKAKLKELIESLEAKQLPLNVDHYIESKFQNLDISGLNRETLNLDTFDTPGIYVTGSVFMEARPDTRTVYVHNGKVNKWSDYQEYGREAALRALAKEPGLFLKPDALFELQTTGRFKNPTAVGVLIEALRTNYGLVQESPFFGKANAPLAQVKPSTAKVAMDFD